MYVSLESKLASDRRLYGVSGVASRLVELMACAETAMSQYGDDRSSASRGGIADVLSRVTGFLAVVLDSEVFCCC